MQNRLDRPGEDDEKEDCKRSAEHRQTPAQVIAAILPASQTHAARRQYGKRQCAIVNLDHSRYRVLASVDDLEY